MSSVKVKRFYLIAVLMNISDEHNSSAPAILTVQIVRCLGGLRIPREIYEPIGGAVPSISANTRAHYDAIMSKYSD